MGNILTNLLRSEHKCLNIDHSNIEHKYKPIATWRRDFDREVFRNYGQDILTDDKDIRGSITTIWMCDICYYKNMTKFLNSSKPWNTWVHKPGGMWSMK